MVGNVSSFTRAASTMRRGKSPRTYRSGEFFLKTGGTSSGPDRETVREVFLLKIKSLKRVQFILGSF